MRIDWRRAIISGIAGTVAFDISGLILAGMLWPEPHLLAEKLGLPLAAGVMGHYANGMLLAVLYAGLAPSLIGPSWFRSITFFTAETVFGIWLFMLPLVGLGPLGLQMGVAFPIIVLVRHWILALVVGFVNPVRDAEMRTQPRMAAA
ncbi:MAG: hypothetical protein U0821_26725 [Chloroflexota bacterium]